MIVSSGQITVVDADNVIEDLRYYSTSGNVIRYGTPGSAGLDLPYYDEKRHKNLNNLPKFIRWFKERKIIFPFIRYKLPTGIHVEMKPNEYGEIDSRSSTSKKKWIPLCRTIDEDYRGNIHVVFMMIGFLPKVIKVGEYRFQMVIKPYNKKNPVRVKSLAELTSTSRGDNGFGHSDQK